MTSTPPPDETLALPDWNVMGEAFATLAQELPRFENLWSPDANEQLVQLNDNIARLSQQMTQLATAVTAQSQSPAIVQLNEKVDGLIQKVGSIEAAVDGLSTSVSLLPMRLHNSSPGLADGPLLGPAGEFLPIGTKSQLRVATGPELDALSAALKVPNYPENGSEDERRDCICKYLGIPVPMAELKLF